MPELQDVARTVEKFRQAAHGNDGESLSRTLNDFNAERGKMGSAFAQFADNVARDLQKQGLLPEVALVFTREKIGDKASPKEISKADLANFKPNNDLERKLVGYVLNNFDQIRNFSTNDGPGGRPSEGITRVDIEVGLRQRMHARQMDEHSKTGHYGEPITSQQIEKYPVLKEMRNYLHQVAGPDGIVQSEDVVQARRELDARKSLMTPEQQQDFNLSSEYKALRVLDMLGRGQRGIDLNNFGVSRFQLEQERSPVIGRSHEFLRSMAGPDGVVTKQDIDRTQKDLDSKKSKMTPAQAADFELGDESKALRVMRRLVNEEGSVKLSDLGVSNNQTAGARLEQIASQKGAQVLGKLEQIANQKGEQVRGRLEQIAGQTTEPARGRLEQIAGARQNTSPLAIREPGLRQNTSPLGTGERTAEPRREPQTPQVERTSRREPLTPPVATGEPGLRQNVSALGTRREQQTSLPKEAAAPPKDQGKGLTSNKDLDWTPPSDREKRITVSAEKPAEKAPLPFDKREGTKITDLDPKINPRLGCALAVSDLLNAQNPKIGVTTNTRALEADLKRNGYEAVVQKQPLNPNDLKPGDVILGFRPGEMPSHAAVYKGNGKLYENNSDTGKIDGNGDVNKFNQKMHDQQGNWQKNGFEQVIVLRKRQDADVASEKAPPPRDKPPVATGQGERATTAFKELLKEKVVPPGEARQGGPQERTAPRVEIPQPAKRAEAPPARVEAPPAQRVEKPAAPDANAGNKMYVEKDGDVETRTLKNAQGRKLLETVETPKQRVERAYDQTGRLKGEIVDDKQSGRTSLRGWENGKTVYQATIEKDGSAVHTNFDATTGHRTRQRNTDAQGTVTAETNWSYHANGEVKQQKQTDRNGSITRNYGTDGKMTEFKSVDNKNNGAYTLYEPGTDKVILRGRIENGNYIAEKQPTVRPPAVEVRGQNVTLKDGTGEVKVTPRGVQAGDRDRGHIEVSRRGEVSATGSAGDIVRVSTRGVQVGDQDRGRVEVTRRGEVSVASSTGDVQVGTRGVQVGDRDRGRVEVGNRGDVSVSAPGGGRIADIGRNGRINVNIGEVFRTVNRTVQEGRNVEYSGKPPEPNPTKRPEANPKTQEQTGTPRPQEVKSVPRPQESSGAAARERTADVRQERPATEAQLRETAQPQDVRKRFPKLEEAMTAEKMTAREKELTVRLVDAVARKDTQALEKIAQEPEFKNKQSTTKIADAFFTGVAREDTKFPVSFDQFQDGSFGISAGGTHITFKDGKVTADREGPREAPTMFQRHGKTSRIPISTDTALAEISAKFK